MFFVEQISATAQVVLNEVYYKQAYFSRVGLILKKKKKNIISFYWLIDLGKINLHPFTKAHRPRL